MNAKQQPAPTAGGSPTIDDILRKSAPATKGGPQVKAYEGRSGWSEDAINLAPLGLVDVDARLALAGVLWRELKLGATQMTVGLQKGQLKTTIDDTRLYEGQGRGVLTLDGAGRIPAIGLNMALDGVSGLPLLKDASGFDWVAGKAKVQVAVAGQGVSQKAIMESLAGKAELTFADGAIVGIDIPQAVRGVTRGSFKGFTRTPTEKTDFTEAGASFQIKGGVAETKDMRILGPQLRMAGAGTIGLGQRQVDLNLRPRLATVGAVQAGAGEAGGLELPVRVRGPWEKPAIAPDMDAVLKNSGQAVEAAREIGRQIQERGGIDESTKARAREVLQNLMKR